MTAVIILEHRFLRTPDSAVWSQTMFSSSFWERYLEVFDRVKVVARVQDVASVPADYKRTDSEQVLFAVVPYYLGPSQFLLKAQQVQKAVCAAISPTDVVVLRAPGRLSTTAVQHLMRVGQPFGLEVVGDPYEVFAPGAVKHPLRPFFRWLFLRQLRQQCKAAAGVAYVTEKALQQKYPVSEGAFSTHYSSIELGTEGFVTAPRTMPAGPPYKLVTVGSLAQLYKAPDVLIEACRLCLKEGLELQLVFIGDGKHRQELEALVKCLGLVGQVRFLGQLSAGQAVREQLDQADLFVLPSRTEGLPRAMIEAMARGLPCIGSTAGGIPELLPPEDMVPPGNAVALAAKMREVLTDPARMARMSARNLEKASEYREEVLRERRVAFYRHIKEATEAWIREKGL